MTDRELPLDVTGIGRVAEIGALLGHVRAGHCCSLVGVSNMGKTRLLRALAGQAPQSASSAPRADGGLTVYVDCNRMLHLSEQGFYELILRCLRELPADSGERDTPQALLEQAYAEVVQPNGTLTVPLAFNRALSALLEESGRRLVLLLDEFDDPLRALDGRVLLNLRALRDQFGERLVYVTATCQPLELTRGARDSGADEFCELFAAQVHHLGPMSPDESIRLLTSGPVGGSAPAPDGASLERAWPAHMAEQLNEQAAGHPGLLFAAAACITRATGKSAGARRLRGSAQGLRDLLDEDPTVQGECDKLWDPLTPQERRALEELASLGTSRLTAGLRSLVRKGLVRDDGERLRLFAPIWERYVQRQRSAHQPGSQGVQVDAGTNEAWVDGRPVPYLTPLESRLLLMLREHAGRLCTKEDIVEVVYGRAYIQNDDPALQRLVRRLRVKIEADPSHPTHILSVRGYGYKLAKPADAQ